MNERSMQAPSLERPGDSTVHEVGMSESNPDDALTQLHFAPGHLVRRARQFHDALWLELIGSELTPLQFAALTALAAEPGLNQRELGDRIALDKSTLGDIVTRLVRNGLVKRQPDPRDRRSRAITITAAGARALNRTRPAVGQIGRIMLSCLEPEERPQLTSLLAKMVFSDLALATTNNSTPSIPAAGGVAPWRSGSTPPTSTTERSTP